MDDECEWYDLDNTKITRVATRMTCVTRMTGLTRIFRMTGVTDVCNECDYLNDWGN